jgi:hypothetical protein
VTRRKTFQVTADQGNSFAQFAYGQCLERGRRAAAAAISDNVLAREICLAPTVFVSALSQIAVFQSIWPKPPAFHESPRYDYSVKWRRNLGIRLAWQIFDRPTTHWSEIPENFKTSTGKLFHGPSFGTIP